jgi:cytochrome c553
MTPVAAGLTDTDAEEIGAYFAGLSAKLAPGSLDELMAAEGERLAEGKHCASCHSEGYGGRDQIPRLAGQREDYLVKAMQDYRDGKRAGFDRTCASRGDAGEHTLVDTRPTSGPRSRVRCRRAAATGRGKD